MFGVYRYLRRGGTMVMSPWCPALHNMPCEYGTGIMYMYMYYIHVHVHVLRDTYILCAMQSSHSLRAAATASIHH